MNGLWVDLPDAEREIDERSGGDAVLAKIGHDIINDGFSILRGAVDPSLCDTAVGDFERYVGGAGHSAEQNKDASGRLLRLVNFHLASRAAGDIGTAPVLMKALDFLFGEEAAIYSSLYFEYGTQQPIHRDSPFFETFPRNLFFGAWVALEDISPDAGPLMYVPGGHRFDCDPHKIFDRLSEAGRFTDADELVRESLEQYYGEVIRASAGFGGPVLAHLKKGDAAIWHPQLPHEGSTAGDPMLARRSMVFHCSPASKQVYQHDVFFSHRGEPPPPRYGFSEQNGRKIASSGSPAFQH